MNIQTMKDQISELEGLVGSKQLTINRLEYETNRLKGQTSTKQSTIDRLESEIADLKNDSWEDYFELQFYDAHVALVDQTLEKYHKYGCSDFDNSCFWIYNTEAAMERGYYACPKCH